MQTEHQPNWIAEDFEQPATAADQLATMRSRHLDALHQQRAWVEHWTDDVAAGLKPTPESLSRALAGIDAAIAKAGADGFITESTAARKDVPGQGQHEVGASPRGYAGAGTQAPPVETSGLEPPKE